MENIKNVPTRLVEGVINKPDIYWDFVNYECPEDFITMMEVIRDVLKPERWDFRGITDMNGYFTKDGITVHTYYNIVGITLEYKNGLNESQEKVKKVRGWIQTVWNYMPPAP